MTAYNEGRPPAEGRPNSSRTPQATHPGIHRSRGRDTLNFVKGRERVGFRVKVALDPDEAAEQIAQSLSGLTPAAAWVQSVMEALDRRNRAEGRGRG